MELISTGRLSNITNPNPGSLFRQDILDSRHKAKNLRGVLAVLTPGNEVSYHYHNHRESIIIVISGTATEVIEGKEFSIKPGDILYIPSLEKHGIINNSDNEFRYVEFFTTTSGPDDLVSAGQP